MSAIVSNGGNVVADGTRSNSYTATYSDSGGILESISLSYGEFSLEVLCTYRLTHGFRRYTGNIPEVLISKHRGNFPVYHVLTYL